MCGQLVVVVLPLLPVMATIRLHFGPVSPAKFYFAGYRMPFARIARITSVFSGMPGLLITSSGSGFYPGYVVLPPKGYPVASS
jgi:hypothetical protein